MQPLAEAPSPDAYASGEGAFCLTNFLPLPDSLTTSSSSSLVQTGRLLRSRRGALFLINFLTKVAILGAPTDKGRSPSCKGKPCAPALLSYSY